MSLVARGKKGTQGEDVHAPARPTRRQAAILVTGHFTDDDDGSLAWRPSCCYFLRLSNGPDFQDECLEELDEEKGDEEEDEDENEVLDESRLEEVKRFEEVSDERSRLGEPRSRRSN